MILNLDDIYFFVQGGFQLLIEAHDDDDGVTSSDFLDNIFVDRSLEADVGAATTVSLYTGDRSRVTLLMSFRVDCEDDFYGNDCTVFCAAGRTFTCNEEDGSRDCLPNYYGEDCNVFCRDYMNGFYTCDEEDGSRICDNGYTNPAAFCTESEGGGWVSGGGGGCWREGGGGLWRVQVWRGSGEKGGR